LNSSDGTRLQWLMEKKLSFSIPNMLFFVEPCS